MAEGPVLYICFSLSLSLFLFLYYLLFLSFFPILFLGLRSCSLQIMVSLRSRQGVLCAKRIREKNGTKCVSNVPKNIKVMVQEALAPALDILQSEDLARWEK